MNILTKARIQWQLAGAAMIIAVLVITLLAAGLPAHGQGPGDDTAPGPQQTEPEACGDNPAEVISSGHYAVFDVYWDYDNRTLNNNPCPPSAMHQDDGFGNETTIRTASDANIGQTIFHVPFADGRTVTENDYQFLQDAVADDSQKVWFISSCEPGASSGSGALCVGFSAGLLRASEWIGDVAFQLEVVREPDEAPEDRGRVFVYEGAESELPANAPEVQRITWDTGGIDTAEMAITPGDYAHRTWAFTKPGTYQFDVHVEGHPNPDTASQGVDPISDNETETSEVRRYTFHVGRLADMDAAMAVDNATPSPGDSVVFTITARNDGPDNAPIAGATVALPEGLTYQSADTASGAYDPAAGRWNIGALNSQASATLSITASVDAGTRGREMTVTAIVDATETIGGSTTVAELDPRPDNNTAGAGVTPPDDDNENPVFTISRTVTENAAADSAVGDPAPVRDGDDSAFTFRLSGPGHENFRVDRSGQITVAQGAYLNYECETGYELLLQVSDGKDSAGNSDQEIDAAIGLDLQVADAAESDGNVRVSLKADNSSPAAGETVTLTAQFHNFSQCAPSVSNHVWEHDVVDTGGHTQRQIIARNTRQIQVSQDSAGSKVYYLQGSFTGANGASHSVDLSISVTWR